jgi:hypothetical protein
LKHQQRAQTTLFRTLVTREGKADGDGRDGRRKRERDQERVREGKINARALGLPFSGS